MLQEGSCRVVGKDRLDKRHGVATRDVKDYMGHIVKVAVAQSGLEDNRVHMAEIRPQEEDRQSVRSLRTFICCL
jgi:hypothetical protein